MIGKLLGLAGGLFVYLCVATVIVAAAGLGYAWSQGALDRDKTIQIVALLKGVDLNAIREEAEAKREKAQPSQPSIDDVARARALRSFDLELRRQSLEASVARMKSEQVALTDEKNRYELARTKFEQELKDLREGAIAANSEKARLLLEKIEPTQAKEQILLMIKEGQIKDVVALLAAMPVAKQAKIVGEFKTPEEAEKVAELLELLREGLPEAPLIDSTQKQLATPPTASP